MGAEEENGLTLGGLADRLETLERENARMRSENDELRSKVAMLEGSGKRRGEVPALRSSGTRQEIEAGSSESDALVSRRSLLSKAGAAAVAAVAAGALLNTREAKAHHFLNDPDYDYLQVNRLDAHKVSAKSGDGTIAVFAETESNSWPAVSAYNYGSEAGVYGECSGAGPAVEGLATGTGLASGTGVKGTGRYGVWGESNQAGFYGVTGRNNNTDGTGVRGIGAGKGVVGQSTNGIGVLGESTKSIGVKGFGKNGVYGGSSTAGEAAVEGRNTGGGHGVGAVGKVGLLAFSYTDGWTGAWGRHTGNGSGVTGDSARGTGVSGFSTNGYGGQFDGGKAQLKLAPHYWRPRQGRDLHGLGGSAVRVHRQWDPRHLEEGLDNGDLRAAYTRCQERLPAFVRRGWDRETKHAE